MKSNINENRTTKVYVFGDNSAGQLGVVQKKDENSNTASQRSIKIKELTSMSFDLKISKVKCGKNNTGFITEEGFLFVMGSNKHGKLGIGMTYE